MGYRTYIGSMPKEEYNKIKSMTQKELFDYYKESKDLDSEDDFHIGVYEYGQELYGFGKYTDFDPPKKSLKPFFKNKKVKSHYEEYDFHIVTKEFLAYLIQTYHEHIKVHYNDMVMPFLGEKDEPSKFLNSIKTQYDFPENKHTFDFSQITLNEQSALFKMIEHIRSYRTEWTHLTPYNLEEGQEITTSWKYEYGVFELVRIYKTFDWKNDVMIYYGY